METTNQEIAKSGTVFFMAELRKRGGWRNIIMGPSIWEDAERYLYEDYLRYLNTLNPVMEKQMKLDELPPDSADEDLPPDA